MGRTALAGLVAFLLGGAQDAPELRLQWVRKLPARKAAWEHTPKMVRDAAYELAAAGGLVFTGGEHDGALLALDGATGEERWRFYTEGPIRVAPATDGERVFAGSEDGRLYALDLSGRLLWTFRGGPSTRRILGHERLISAWPVSARPLAAGGRVYVVSGYWPIDGVFVHALDAATGKPAWSAAGAQYRPFGAPRIEAGTLWVDGHGGNGAYDLATGAARAEKAPPRAPAPPAPETPGLKGAPVHRAEADGRVYVSTAEGEIYGFARAPGGPVRTHAPPAAPPAGDAAAAKAVLEATGVRAGYALVAGLEEGALAEGLVRGSELRVVAVDDDPATLDRVRRRLAGLFETGRLSMAAGTEGLPPYFASLVVSESATGPPESVRECLRPYGGAWAGRGGRVERREGPLPGAADWTHEMADAAMTLCSQDRRVKAPLGLLWYGGPAADLRFYFDGNVDHQSGDSINPQPTGAQIVDGRMILQGPGVLGAFDIYTGRLLWETKIPRMYPFGGKGGGLGIHSKNHPEPWRAEPALRAEVPPTHHPRASGFNMVSASDGIYLAAAGNCVRYRPEDGSVLSSWAVPLPEPGLCWGNLWVSGGTLVATAFRPEDLAGAHAGFDGNGGDWAGDRMPMAWLLALDRATGKLLWSRKAEWGFLNRGTALGKGTVFALDLLMEDVLGKLKAGGRALPAAGPAVRALDLATGRERWTFPLDVLVKTLHYSEERDLLVVACRHRTDWKDGAWAGGTPEKKGAPGRMRGLRGADGQVLWEVSESPYAHPLVVVGDLLVDRWGNAFELLTGKRHRRPSALAGGDEEWSFPRGGCNHLVACPAMVTWRTAFYDLAGHSGVTKLAGMDAGCTATLLPAGGILNVPDFGTHHKRNRMTALALVHRPGNEPWADYAEAKPAAPAPLLRAGFNLGAPGDRKAEDGTLWFRAGPRSELASVQPAGAEWFLAPTPPGGSWIASSGVVGASAVTISTRLPADLKGKDRGSRRYTVRLHFAEPSAKGPGERVFSVSLEGKTVLADFDPYREGARAEVAVVREFRGVDVAGPLDVGLVAAAGKTLLCGVELVAE